jgi:ParB family transcriptional regulator, chromosome partitioning protein
MPHIAHPRIEKQLVLTGEHMPKTTTKTKAIATAVTPALAQKTEEKVAPVTPPKKGKEQPPVDNKQASVNGVVLNYGDPSAGGTAKKPLMTMMPRASIVVLPGFNPRRNFTGIEELAAAIKREGPLSTLVVRPTSNEGIFALVSGERRLRAYGLLEAKEVPVLIRTDLKDDDLRARAVAVAENSDNLRSNLNAVELGFVFKDMEKQGWTIPQIAKETCTEVTLVRRCLSLMDAPEDMQQKVAKGELALAPVLEFAKLDQATREAIRASLTTDTSAPEVRKLAKEAARKVADPEKVHDGKRTSGKKGAERAASLATWKSSSEKNAVLAKLCSLLKGAVAANVQEDIEMVHQLRGMVGMLLWDRGDLEEYTLPEMDTKVGEDMKINKLFMSIVTKEALKAEKKKEQKSDD